MNLCYRLGKKGKGVKPGINPKTPGQQNVRNPQAAKRASLGDNEVCTTCIYFLDSSSTCGYVGLCNNF